MSSTNDSPTAHENITVFINETHVNCRKKNYVINETDVYYIDGTWSKDSLELIEYGPKKYKGYLNILVVIDNFSKLAWTVPLKNKTAQTIKNSQETILHQQKKPDLFGTDDRKEVVNKIFTGFSELE